MLRGIAMRIGVFVDRPGSGRGWEVRKATVATILESQSSAEWLVAARARRESPSSMIHARTRNGISSACPISTVAQTGRCPATQPRPAATIRLWLRAARHRADLDFTLILKPNDQMKPLVWSPVLFKPAPHQVSPWRSRDGSRFLERVGSVTTGSAQKTQPAEPVAPQALFQLQGFSDLPARAIPS
jgi:hypothetical protein